MLPMDIHTHTAASGHGTNHTITDMAKAACRKGILTLGISDHGPATPGACRESYFRSLHMAPKERFGIHLLYGAEANILDEHGNLDISEDILSGLDFCIASIHANTFRPHSNMETNTAAYLNAMKNPHVKIIGHVDDTHFPVDLYQVTQAAIHNNVILEVNETSLSPDGYRGNARPNTFTFLQLCLQARYPILLSSDSHGINRIGEVPRSLELVKEISFPRELIWNHQPADALLNFRRCVL